MTRSHDHQPHQAPSYYGAAHHQLSTAASDSHSRSRSRPISVRTSSSATQLDPSPSSSSSSGGGGEGKLSKHSPSSGLDSAAISLRSSSSDHSEHADHPGPLPPTQALQPLASRLSRTDSRSRPLQQTTTIGRTRSLSFSNDAAGAAGAGKPIELHRAGSRASSVHRCADPHYPASALALTLTKSEDPDAIYIDWPPNDPENPFNWPKLRRWALVSTCFLFTACTAFNGCGYPSGSVAASAELHTSQLVYLVGNTTFLFAVSITPLILAPLSEVYGRSPIYLTATFFFTVMFIPQALAKNITTIIVVRWFQGMAASVGNSMVAGSVSDVFHASERGFPMSLYALAVYIAQGVSPYLSSATVNNASWRVMFWWQGGLSLFTSVMMLIVLRETRGPVLLSRRAKQMTKETGRLHKCRADDERLNFFVMVKYSLVRPMQYLVLEPVVLSFALWIGFLWGIIFISLEAIPIVFAEYGWTSDQQHMALLSIAVGGILGYFLNFHQEKLYARTAKKYGGKPPPEARLYYAAAGAILAPIGLFIFAWTGRPTINPAAPIVGLVIFNLALFPVYLAVFSYLADVYERYASSALAAQSFLRNTFASTFPLFSQQMYNNLTPKYASTVLACIGCVLGVVPFILMRYGESIRKRSRAAMALEKEEMEAQEFSRHEEEKARRREARRQARLALRSNNNNADKKIPTGHVDEEKFIESGLVGNGGGKDDLENDMSGESTPTDDVSAGEIQVQQSTTQSCEDCKDHKRLPPTSIL